MPDIRERVHVDVVVVQLFRKSRAARLCEQNPQPAAQIFRAAGLTNATRGQQESEEEAPSAVCLTGL